MTNKLFSSFKVKDTEFKNRIVMSPMSMHSSDEEGEVKNFHLTHYTSRALGQAGLIFLETLIVDSNGLVGPGDLGIWDDKHVKGLSELVEQIQSFGSKVGAQIGHAGRLAKKEGVDLIAPSTIPFNEDKKTPLEMTKEEINHLILEYKEAARRAKKSNFDVLEIHCAHGYLLNEFLSPLSNHRNDDYGGSFEKRYRIVKEIIDTVKEVWQGPLFVRISATDYHKDGNTNETYIEYAKLMKDQGVDLIDCSSGGIAPVKVDSYPNYQVPAADKIKNIVDIPTGAVGLITTGRQAEEILKNNRADLIFIGREFLKNPFWPRQAAEELNATIDAPIQYTRYGSRWLSH